MVVYSKVVDITKVELREAEVNEKQSRDKNETCSYSILHIVMRRKFLALNLEKRPNKIVFNLARDKIEIHNLQSKTSRRERAGLIFVKEKNH